MRNETELIERLAGDVRSAAVRLDSEEELADMLLDVVAAAGVEPEALPLEQWKRLLVNAARAYRTRSEAAYRVCC